MIIPLLLTSCNNSVAIYTPTLLNVEKYDLSKDYSTANIEDYTIKLTPQTCKTMIENKENFCLWYHNLGCASCNLIKPSLIRYICETKKTIYSIDIGNDETFLDLQATCHDLTDSKGTKIFFNDSGETSTPIFFFFKEGELLKKQLGQSNLANYNFLSRFMNSFLGSSTLKFINGEQELINIQNDVIYYYNNSHTYEVSIYNALLTSNAQLNIYNTSIFPNITTSQIINYANNTNLDINSNTTIEDVLMYLNS